MAAGDSVVGAGAPHGEARFAGFIYAIVVVAGVFALAYAPEQLFAGETGAEMAPGIAEFLICLWLLLLGARRSPFPKWRSA